MPYRNNLIRFVTSYCKNRETREEPSPEPLAFGELIPRRQAGINYDGFVATNGIRMKPVANYGGLTETVEQGQSSKVDRGIGTFKP